jgi:hypothetical protein
MKLTQFQFIAPLVALAMVIGLFLQVRTYAAQDDSAPFHAKIRQLVARIPNQIGRWEGADGKVPQAAGKLLKPNAMFCRHYRNDSTGRTATVLLVHCRDSRDMTGHYPPVCYPGHGWTSIGDVQYRTLPLWGREAPFAVYQFSQSEVNRTLQFVIYDLFILPKAGMVNTMAAVVSASADYRTRPYGAAQLQVIFDAGEPESERIDSLQELLAPFAGVVDSLNVRDGGPKP